MLGSTPAYGTIAVMPAEEFLLVSLSKIEA
jgi:hypothetical protein